jgi:hypothetical protein
MECLFDIAVKFDDTFYLKNVIPAFIYVKYFHRY